MGPAHQVPVKAVSEPLLFFTLSPRSYHCPSSNDFGQLAA